MFGGDWGAAAARSEVGPPASATEPAIAQASKAAAARRGDRMLTGSVGACPGTLELIDLRRSTRRVEHGLDARVARAAIP